MTLPINWFDVLLLTVVTVGIVRGRKRGMSEELLSLLMWLSITIGCAFAYEPLGLLIAGGETVFSKMSGYLIAYILAAMVIAGIFAFIRRNYGTKLVGSDAFGQSEFYLGMFSGMVRFLCILVAGLALLNARYYSPKEITDEVKYQNDVYGSNFFPKLFTLQAQVFEQSLAGPWIKNNLSFLLIKPTAPTLKQPNRKNYYALP